MRVNTGRAPARRDDEHLLLYQATGTGAVIGSYLDHSIHETLVDEFDRTYSYLGLAPRRSDGSFDAALIAAGEYVLPPGLLYRRDDHRDPDGEATLSPFCLHIH
jgi:hypothetical protein